MFCAGTDTQRLLVLHIAHSGEVAPVLVLDHKFNITYATADLAAMLGYTTKQMTHLSLEDILPSPFGPLHRQWATCHKHVPPATSCRAGQVVSLCSAKGAAVAVKLDITERANSEDGRLEYVVKV